MRNPSSLRLLGPGIVSCVLASLVVNAASGRTWTDVQNRRVEAELIRVEGTSVILRLGDGKEVPYPLEKLSAVDREFVKTVPAEKPASATGLAKAEVVAGSIGDEPTGFDGPWPDTIRYSEEPEITTVKEDSERKSFIYESPNYRYVCDVRLSKSVVKGFAVLFEATHRYCRSLPLMWDGGTKTAGKYQILLFGKKDDYVRAGGPARSAGVFMSGKAAVLIPLESLGVKPVGSGYMLDRDKSSGTIPHELTHQLSPRAYFASGAEGWFGEGMAEYVGQSPYRNGTFSVKGNFKTLVDYVTAYGRKENGGRALGNKIAMPPLKAFMLQDYESFQEQPQLGYGCGLLMTIYFLHMDGEGDGRRLKEFLKALRSGKSGERALEVLLDGRSYEQLQDEFAKAWSRKGVDFSFDG